MKKYLVAILIICNWQCINAAATTELDDLKILELFGQVLYKVKTDYVVEKDNKALIEAAINGMLSSLDPHSSYLDQKAFDEMRYQTKGEYGGIGVAVTLENGLVKVIGAIEDTPGYKAGLKTGDYIIMVNGEPVLGQTLSEAVQKIRGEKGTYVTLTALREGSKEPLELKVKREAIKITNVKSRVEEDIAYIRILTFAEKTAAEVKTAFNTIQTQLGANLKGVVLDLRNNPGGVLDQAIAVSNLFLKEGEIVSTRGRNPENIIRYRAQPGKSMTDLPTIILIDGGSASASEIVAGALQDHKRAIIMGTESFGKATVQSVIPLPENNGAIRLTTARYYTPAGRSIQAEGIKPDITIEQAKIEFEEKKPTRRRLNEAAYRNHLTKEEPAISIPKIDKNAEYKKAMDAVSSAAAKSEIADYQLSRALDLLRAMYILELQKVKS